MLVCPVCQSVLVLEGKNLSCEKNHSFDQAKQGYFNLLLNTAKNSQSPGDNAAMVKARQQFLDSGLYKSISDTVNQLVVDHFLSNPVESPMLLDLACGEGYYTQHLHYTLEDHQVQHSLYGLDISKDAIKASAKREKSINWIVANGFKAPFKSHSLHCVLNMFNRVNSKSLHDLCHPQGKVIVASSAKFHLQQLKQAIYQQPRFEEFDMVATMENEFEHDVRQQLDFTIKLKPENTQALLGMTPHAWRSSPETQQQLVNNPQFELRVNVNIDSFTPKLLATSVTEAPVQSEIIVEQHIESKAKPADVSITKAPVQSEAIVEKTFESEEKTPDASVSEQTKPSNQDIWGSSKK
jgi:23S rRNA (guanine745-N1)-methyltransferase